MGIQVIANPQPGKFPVHFKFNGIDKDLEQTDKNQLFESSEPATSYIYDEDNFRLLFFKNYLSDLILTDSRTLDLTNCKLAVQLV